MSEHKALVTWKRSTPDFVYETYDRTHSIRFEGGIECKASSAPEFLGKKEYVNPEESFAAALSSCHMLTFLAVAAKSRLTVDRYEDNAVAILEKNAEGKMCVTKVHLRPKIQFSGEVPTAEKVKDLHAKAHKHCFIANSVSCAVSIE